MIEQMSYREWELQGSRLFGPDMNFWQFICPVCGNIQSPRDFHNLGKSWIMTNEAYHNCIGRHLDSPRDALTETGAGPCNYSSGGLFDLRPVEITMQDGAILKTFAFAIPVSEVDQADPKPQEH